MMNLARQRKIHFKSLSFQTVSASTIIPLNESWFCSKRRKICNFDGNIALSTSRLLDIKRYHGGSNNFGQNYDSKKRKVDENQEEDDGELKPSIDKGKIPKNYPDLKNNNNDPLTSLMQMQYRVSKNMRKSAGTMFSLMGFLGSSAVSFATDERSIQDRFHRPIRALNNFLKTSGVDDELSKSLNPRLGVNLCLLGQVHMHMAANNINAKASDCNFSSSKISSSFLEEARRYMRYATVVYGQAMITAAEVDARGCLDGKVGRLSKEAASTYISVPTEDIVSMDISNYDGDSNHLRHMVVVDHKHKKVILSIRGTFSLEEIVVDVVGFSREFCDGEAHSEMATMAERVWDVAGPKIKATLEENLNYELIVTGHSLGAGAACLLTILVQSKQMLPIEQKIRCFAYASPPVYAPLKAIPDSSIIHHIIHENDCIPFLSVQTIRKLFCSLRAIDLYSQNHMNKREKYKIILGALEPPKDLINCVVNTEGKVLEPKKGSPILFIPAQWTIWLKERLDDKDSSSSYYYDLLTSDEISQKEIRVYPDMLVDHLPARYEYALDRLIS